MKFGGNAAKIELLAFRLYSYFSNEVENPPSALHVSLGIALLDKEWIEPFKFDIAQQSEEPHQEVDDVIRQVSIQASIVRGDAYPFQTAERIEKIQGKFDNFFEKKSGISPTRALAVVRASFNLTQQKNNAARNEVVLYGEQSRKAWKDRKQAREPQGDVRSADQAYQMACVSKSIEILPERLPIALDDLGLEPVLTSAEKDALRRAFGVGIGCESQPKTLQELIFRPFVFLSANHFLLADTSNAHDQVWRHFDDAAKADSSFYDCRYNKHRAKWLQDAAGTVFRQIFDTNSVFEGLTYQDPDKEGTAELDLAIWCEPYLLLVELKSSQFRFEGQLGNVGKLRTDLVRNLEDAYAQASRAQRYLDGTATPQLVEIAGFQRTLRLNKNRIQKTYLLTVSLNHLAGLATRLTSLRPLGLFKEGTYPWASCISDLQLLSRYLSGPDEFIHYLDRRLWLQGGKLNVVGDEMDLFGAYLESRLHPASLFGDGYEETTKIILSGFHSAIDDAIIGEQHGQPPKVISLKVPNEIRSILNELRSRQDDPRARAIAFTILDMERSHLISIAEIFQSMGSQSNIAPGRYRRCTVFVDGVVITVTAAANPEPVEAHKYLVEKVGLEKYRRKARKSIGLSINVTNRSRAFDTAVYLESDWVADPVFERALEEGFDFKLAPGSKRPGRNDPCPCGSGKKFKKCHLRSC